MNDPPDGDVLSLNADSLTLTAECNHVLYKPCIVININKPHLETTGHTTVTIGVVYRCPNITKENNEKIHNTISEVSKGDCIIMWEFNLGNIKWYTLRSTGVEDQILVCLVQDNFLTQHMY